MIINMRGEPYLKNGLQQFIQQLPNNCIIVEVGSYAGHSAELFLNSNKIKTLYCIDPWCNGYDDKDSASESDMIEVENSFDTLVLNKFDNVIKLKHTSKDAVKLFEDESLDCVYIDANHQYEAVKEDILLWLPKVKKNGIISGHDYWITNYASPKLAIDEIFGRPDRVFEDSSWMVIKK